MKPNVLESFFQIFGMASTYFPGFLASQFFQPRYSGSESQKAWIWAGSWTPPCLGIRIPPVDGEKNLVFQGDLFVRDIN
jgi:hypothetical protein